MPFLAQVLLAPVSLPALALLQAPSAPLLLKPQASHVLPLLPPHPGYSLFGEPLGVLPPPSHLRYVLPPRLLPAAKHGPLKELPSLRFFPISGFVPSHSCWHSISGGKHNAFSNFLFFLRCLGSLSYLQGSKGKMALPQLVQLKLLPFHLLQLASSWLSFKPPLETVLTKLFFA